MINRDYQLLVLDIDGTVINSSKKLTDKTKNAIIRLQKEGVRVVLASGRPPKGVYSIAEELEINKFGNYVLAFNGAKIIELSTRQCIYEKKLPRHIPRRLWEDVKEYGLGLVAYAEDTLIAGTMPDKYMQQEQKICQMPIEYHADFKKYMDFQVNECLITGCVEELETIEPILTTKYFHETQIFHSESCFLEVVPKNVDKAFGLKHLLQILGISREDMICCGDSFNDVTMLRHAGVGVAMANAPKEVQLIADYVTTNDNNHDGIVEVIERFWG